MQHTGGFSLNACSSGVSPPVSIPSAKFTLSLWYFSIFYLFLTRSSVPRSTSSSSVLLQAPCKLGADERTFSLSLSSVARGHSGLLTNVHCTKLSALSTTLRAVPPHHLPFRFFSLSFCFFFFFFFSLFFFLLPLVRRRAARRRQRRRRLQKRAAGPRTVTAAIMTQRRRRRCDDGLPRRRRKNVGAAATPGGDSTRAQVANVYDND